MFHLSKLHPGSISILSGHMAGMMLIITASCTGASSISTDNESHDSQTDNKNSRALIAMPDDHQKSNGYLPFSNISIRC